MPPPPHQQPYPHQPQQPYPHQPYPYGQQLPQAPGQYGTPYPQQQPYPPQPPGPQQQYPGWGVPPMGPPPKKRRVGLVLGIVGGVVAVGIAGVLAIGALFESGFPTAKNKLTLPRTLADGRFELAQDLSDSAGQKIEGEADGAWDARDVVAVIGRYGVADDVSEGQLVISGMYGRFRNTDEARGNMLKGAAGAEGVTVAVTRRDFTQDGAPTISCEVLTQKKLGVTMTYPLCAWNDGNTGAAVAVMTPKTAHQDPSDVDLAFYAKFTRQIRSETIRPIG
ncbi:hypothetical protein ACFZCP_03035 [Streptomyces sp. NPDC007971]|uniref:hypothetical protein n=1 Tax=Streptomyces sp. NPDC007971 TaxID=3364799 RepID=UPI0036EE1D40